MLRSAVVALTLTLAVAGGARAQDEEQAAAGQPATEAAATLQPTFDQPGYGIAGFFTRPNFLDAGVGLAYSDNVFLVAADRQSAAIGTIGLLENYSYAGGNLNIESAGNINWLHYSDDLFPSTLYGNFTATAMWGRSSDLLQWVVRETYDEGQPDPLAPATPAYLRELNYVTTGPYLNFNFGALDRLTFYGLYSNTAMQSATFSSQGYEGGSTLTHALSGASSVSLQVDAVHTTYDRPGTGANDTPVGSSYNLPSVRVLYDASFVRTQASVGLGYSAENYGGRYTGAPLASLQLARVLSDYLAIYVRGNYGYSTFGNALQNNASAPLSVTSLLGFTPAYTTSGPLKEQQFVAGCDFNRARTTFSLVASVGKIDTVDQDAFNSNAVTLGGSLGRQLTPSMWLRLATYASHYGYGTLNGRVTFSTLNLSLGKQFRKLGLSLYAQRSHQSYSGVAAPLGLVTGDYVEDRVGIQASYDLIGRGSAAAGSLTVR
jgi:hypothetical protein